MCYRCFWPEHLCWCGSIAPMPTRTKFVFLMHPHELKRVRVNTGRLTHLCLADSVIHVGIKFDEHEAVQALIQDPGNFPVLVYPGKQARDLSTGELSATDFAGRRLVVFLLDGTWHTARKTLRASPSLERLPRIMFSNAARSRYVIKKQPEPGCLSTLEATHELLVALERAGLDRYPLPDQLLGLFRRMQDFQVECAAKLNNRRHARRGPRPPGPPPEQNPRRRRIFPAAARPSAAG